MHQLSKNFFCFLVTFTAIYATEIIDVSKPYSYGQRRLSTSTNFTLQFSNGVICQSNNTNESYSLGDHTLRCALFFLDTVSTATYNQSTLLNFPDTSSDEFTPAINNVSTTDNKWNPTTFPAISGIDTFTTSLNDGSTGSDSIIDTIAGHLLFTAYYREAQGIENLRFYEGHDDILYFSVFEKPSLRLKFYLPPDESPFSPTYTLIWESDSLGNGIFKGLLAAQNISVDPDSIKCLHPVAGEDPTFKDSCIIENGAYGGILTRDIFIDSISIVSISNSELSDNSPLLLKDIEARIFFSSEYWEKEIGGKFHRIGEKTAIKNYDSGYVKIEKLIRGNVGNYLPDDPETTHFWMLVNVHLSSGDIVQFHIGGYAVPGAVSLKSGDLGINNVIPKTGNKKISQYNLKGQLIPSSSLKKQPAGIMINNQNINNQFQKNVIRK